MKVMRVIMRIGAIILVPACSCVIYGIIWSDAVIENIGMWLVALSFITIVTPALVISKKQKSNQDGEK